MVEECTGCLGCIDICKVGALDVETMEDGFICKRQTTRLG